MTKPDKMTAIPDDDDNSLGARIRRFAVPMLCFAAGLALLLSGIAWPSLSDHAPEQRWTLAIMAAIFHVALAWRRWRDR